MRRLSFLVVTVSLCLAVVPARAGSGDAATSPKSSGSGKTPGVEIAQTISMITGVAISPLLGVGAVGAWKYFEAKTPEQRARLPWFANPLFWVPALLLIVLVFLKDVLGTAAPAILKKPFDAAEVIENKISGLVAAGAFVPYAAAIFRSTSGGDSAFDLSAGGFAAVDLSWLYNALAVPIAMVAFVLVWLVSHSVNVLILVSPFSTVDAALKSARASLLATVPVTSWVDPYLGAVWALIIIVIAYFLAGWSFRFMIFGTVFVWDFLTRRRKRFRPDPAANWLFLAREVDKVPVRTYGKLLRGDQGGFTLKYRPWLFLPERTLTLPKGDYEVGRGLLYSEVLRVKGDETKSVLTLPPRYRGHEAELVQIYGLAGVRDVGLRAAWTGLKELFGFKAKAQPTAA